MTLMAFVYAMLQVMGRSHEPFTTIELFVLATISLGLAVGGVIGIIVFVRNERMREEQQRQLRAFALANPDFPMRRPDWVLK